MLRLTFPMLLFLQVSSFGQDAGLHAIMLKLVGMKSEKQELVADCPGLSAEKIWQQLSFLEEQGNVQKRLNGKANVSFSSNNSQKQSLYQVFGGIDLSRGIYPGQFRLKTDLGITLSNGKFNENISNFHFSYDYHSQLGDKLFMENYFFMNRFSDVLLGIDQRYEIGGGAIFQFWSRKKLLKSGVKDLEKANAIRFDSLNAPIWTCMDSVISRYIGDTLIKSDREELIRAQQRAIHTARKKSAKLRFGALVGLFYEIERANFTDTVFFATGPAEREVSFEPTNKVRFEIRPTLSLKLTEEYSFSLRPYFKFPMPWSWYEYVEGTREKGLQDYRVNIEADFSIRLGELFDASNKRVTLDLKYNYFYDHAPARRYLTEAGNEPVLFSAPNAHGIFQLAFAVEL